MSSNQDVSVTRVLRILRPSVSVILIAVLIALYDTDDLSRELAGLDAAILCGGLALFVVSVGAAVVKWRLGIPSAPVGLALRVYLESLAISLLPTGQLGGEASKLTLAADGHPLAAVAASVVYDKLTSLVALTVIGIVAAAASSDPLASMAMGFFELILVGITGSIVVAPRLVNFATGRGGQSATLVRVRRLVSAVADLARQPTLFLRSVAVGIVSQGATLCIYLLVAHGLAIDVDAFDLSWIVVLANLAAIVPISAAGLGVRELGLIALLSRYEVAGEQALALSLSCFGIFCVGALAGLLAQFVPSRTQPSAPTNDC